MALPPCVMRDPRPFPDGSTQHYCRHPQYPYRLRLLALHPDHCHICPLRQETGSPPPATPMPPPVPDRAAYTPGRPRPDLQAIELTLPPAEQESQTRPRPVFEPDGAIRYPVRDNDWEPPRDINGYVRDPDNPWRFLPLWLPCGLRLPQGFIRATCGCIGLNMRCNQPQAPTFGQQVPSTTCKTCQHRSQ